MKKHLLKLFLSFFGLLSGTAAFAQGIQLSQPVYTACPNQIMTVTATWPNVGGVTYSLASPVGGNPGNGALASGVFTITHSSAVATNVNFTLSATGTSLTGQVSASVVVPVSIIPPAPLTFTNQIDYCPGNTAQIIAPLGGTSYNINSPCFNATNLQSNIINIPNLSAVHNCTYLVTSVGSCTATGITTINVAPATPITVNSPSNVCQFGTVALTASLPGGQSFAWYDPFGTLLGNGPTYNIASASPNSQGSYSVTANLPFNTITCPRVAVTQVNVVATSAINVAASPSGILCQGDKLTFNAGASNNVQGWTWSGPQAFSASSPNPVINPVTPLNTGVYTVSALFTNNIITCTTSTTIPISIIPVNTPIISLPSSVCQSVNVNISASATGANGGYTWFGPNGFTYNGASTTINTVQPNASGIYYVTAKFGLSTTTCAATSSAQLNVVPVNSVSIIPPTPVCQPDNGNLQASAIGANQYLWQGPNGFVSPGPNATIYYPTPSASGVYTVTAYFIGSNLTCTSSNTSTLTVNPILVFSLTPRQQACYDASISVSGPPGATGYTWTSSTGFTSNNKDISFNSIQPNNSGTYTLNVSLGPCITSASTTIEVLDRLSYTLTPLSRTICRGDTALLEAGATGGSENYAFTWNPSVFLDGPTGPVKTAVPLGSIIYNVTVHDIACPNFTVSHQFTINVLQPPTPVIELEKSRSCSPFVLNIDPKTQGQAAFTTYDFGGDMKIQPLEKDANKLINYVLKDAGSYSLTITSKGTNGCTGIYKLPYPLIVDPLPGSDIIWSPEVPTTNDVIEFTPTAQSGPITKYLWEFSGGVPTVIDTTIKPGPHSDTSNVMHPSRKYDVFGVYPVMLISTNVQGCSDTSVKFMRVIDDFAVFIPNTFTPNGDGLNDLFQVKGSGMKTESFSMELSDRWGNQVYFTKDITAGWDGKVNGKEAENGVYIYKLKIVGMNGEGRKEFIGYFTILR